MVWGDQTGTGCTDGDSGSQKPGFRGRGIDPREPWLGGHQDPEPLLPGLGSGEHTSGRVGSSSLNPCSGGPHSEEADEGSSPWPTWVCWALLDSLPPSGPTLPHLLCSFLDGCPGRRLGVMAWWGEALSWESGHLGPSLSLSLPHWVALTLCFHRSMSAQRGSPASIPGCC